MELMELPPKPTEKDRLIPVLKYQPNSNDHLHNDPYFERSCCCLVAAFFLSVGLGATIFLLIMFFS